MPRIAEVDETNSLRTRLDCLTSACRAPANYLLLVEFPEAYSSGRVALHTSTSGLPESSKCRASDHTHNCQCCIIGLMPLGKIIHRIEDHVDEGGGLLRALHFVDQAAYFETR